MYALVLALACICVTLMCCNRANVHPALPAWIHTNTFALSFALLRQQSARSLHHLACNAEVEREAGGVSETFITQQQQQQGNDY